MSTSVSTINPTGLTNVLVVGMRGEHAVVFELVAVPVDLTMEAAVLACMRRELRYKYCLATEPTEFDLKPILYRKEF